MSLLKKIIKTWLFTFINFIDITSFLCITQYLFFPQWPLITVVYAESPLIKDKYNTLFLKDFYDYTNLKYSEYRKSANNGILLADLDSLIEKLRRHRQPGRHLTCDEIFAIKLVGVKHGFSDRTCIELKGLGNGRLFEAGNFPAYSGWSGDLKVERRIRNELIRIRGTISQIEVNKQIEIQRIRNKTSINNIMN